MMVATDADSGKRVALLGGSFNPPHLGHLMICLWALSTRRADAVWLVPTYRHAFSKTLVDFAHRHAMCQLATASFAQGGVFVSAVEETLGGQSRTARTLRHLRQQHAELQFSLLLGADLLAELSSWQDIDEIRRSTELLMVGRAGHEAAGATLVLPDISSREIRQRLAAGQDVSHEVPAAVLAYIRDHRLYAADPPKR